jgi:hypothetical protein
MLIGNSVTISSSTSQRYDYLQATEASVMQALFVKYIVDLMAENVVRVGNSQLAYNIVDIDIAGGGDGFTFVLRVLLSTTTNADGWTAANLTELAAVFWMGSDADALADYAESAIAALRAQQPGATIQKLGVGHAGASKGTRFMGFLAGVFAGG